MTEHETGGPAAASPHELLLESQDIGAAMGTLATSQEPFDRWFRDLVKDVHGLDLSVESPPPEQVLDYRA